MTNNHLVITKIVELLPQYPEEISKRELCEKVGIKDYCLNSYLCSVTYMCMLCENENMLSRCENYYQNRGA